MMHCVQCCKPLVDPKTGDPLHDRIICGKVCKTKDHREKIAAKRRKLRAEVERRVRAELKRRGIGDEEQQEASACQ